MVSLNCYLITSFSVARPIFERKNNTRLCRVCK
uniref:Uncharacterized protein n=1 Tax=Siphoviridae sp. ctkJH11 TaxID=2825641 RepID=A0A8S5PS18_9CAUD|nr:MAG TPA: hypothetical protein [Siphoviridae sp. ctkJH11]